MAANVKIPKLGMTMKEATLVEWKLNEGDSVKTGDVLLLIETDKTKFEIEAQTDGLLHIIVPIDKTEPIGKLVGLIAESEDELTALQKDSAAAVAAADAEPVPEAEPEAEKKPAAAKPPAKGAKVKASPVAKKLAAKEGIDLATVTGTGPGGRITKEDVEQAIEAAKAAPAGVAAAAAGGPFEVRDGKRVKEAIPLKGMRKVISDHMHESLSVAAQLTSMGEIEMTELVKLRAELVAREEELGTRITYTDLYVLAAAKALKYAPMVNSSLIDGEIIVWEDINIGVAVALTGQDATGGGLIVPVVRNADQKSLTEISKELRATVLKARDGKLMPDDVSGGTFTVTNTGTPGGGWGHGTPIINQPQCAILGTGSIVDRPVVRDGEIVIRQLMPISFTFDHRVLDGVPAGRFSGRFAQLIRNPALMLC